MRSLHQTPHSDVRVLVFRRVIDWVIYLGTRGRKFKFAIVENVTGILRRYKGQPSMMTQILRQLRAALQDASMSACNMAQRMQMRSDVPAVVATIQRGGSGGNVQQQYK